MCDVLVVEDHDIVRMVLVTMLEDSGLTVREAATPQEALRIAREPAGCSMLVTDIDLGIPDTDGFAVASEIHRHSPGLPVLFVSGRPTHFNGRALSDKERVLNKPFSSDQLLGAVRALLTG